MFIPRDLHDLKQAVFLKFIFLEKKLFFILRDFSELRIDFVEIDFSDFESEKKIENLMKFFSKKSEKRF